MDKQAQLLKIRQKRHENAQTHLARCRNALERAVEALRASQAAVKQFAAFRRQKIEQLYQLLIGRHITPKKLQDTRFSETQLNEKLSKLKAEVGVQNDKVEEKKNELAAARAALMQSQKALAKAEEICDLAREDKKAAELMAENNALDEFAGSHRRSAAALGCALFLFSAEPLVSEEAYYRALDQNLPLVLQDVADRFDLSLNMIDIPNRRISGEYKMRSAAQFLQTITPIHQLDWMIQDQTLFILPRTQRKRREFSLENATRLEDFYHYLTHVRRIASTPFPLQRDDDQYVLIVIAPEVYLRYISAEHEKFITGTADQEIIKPANKASLLQNPATDNGVMIFRLEHAWAADKTYTFANSASTVPGVATILRRLTGAKGEEKTPPSPAAAASDSVKALDPVAAPRRQAPAPQADKADPAIINKTYASRRMSSSWPMSA